MGRWGMCAVYMLMSTLLLIREVGTRVWHLRTWFTCLTWRRLWCSRLFRCRVRIMTRVKLNVLIGRFLRRIRLDRVAMRLVNICTNLLVVNSSVQVLLWCRLSCCGLLLLMNLLWCLILLCNVRLRIRRFCRRMMLVYLRRLLFMTLLRLCGLLNDVMRRMLVVLLN